MIIKYTNFSDGIHKLKFEEPVEKLGLDNLFLGNVAVDCTMDKSIHQVVLNCKLAIKAHLNCDRCNEDYETELNSEFLLSFLFVHEKIESDDFNLKYLSPDQDKIDISEDVIEYVRLTLPMKNLCNENCKGLCPYCGINLNEKKCNCTEIKYNDVWEPLKKMKFNN